jgi:aminoethylphosphonate catabolism LysR family transcriptional regulator
MRLTQLRSFLAVARAGGFTAAARILHVSQPTLTTQIRLLEEQYGVELFHRIGRGVRLTDTGRQLFELAGPLANVEEDAVHLLRDTGELRTGTLTVGAVGPYQATDMLAAFSRKYPGVTVCVRFGNSASVLQELLDVRTDVAVLAHFSDDPRLHNLPYSRARVVAFVPRRHRLAGKRSIRIAQLAGERLVMRETGSTTRRALEAAFARAHVKPRIAMEVGSREAIREAVAKGIGVGTVSEAGYTPDSRLCMLRIADAEVWTETHVVCLRARREARVVKSFLAIAESLRQPVRAGSR